MIRCGMIHWAARIMMAAAALLAGCSDRQPRAEKELIIFYAGSLSIPVRQLAELFEAANPGVTVRAEAAGSRLCARKISELNKPCDVMMSADARVVESLLMPTYARFNIRFATNEMVIAYRAESAFAGEISAGNWADVLLRPGVVIGRSEPDSDPAGYRALHVFQLVQRALDQPGLAECLEIQRTVVRPKSTDLLALLGMGEIDYLLIYRSVAAQHGLKMIELPVEINLASSAMADVYATASVELTGRRPDETITRKGAPIEYSITIPAGAPNAAAAEAWVALLLSDVGREVMERNGQPSLMPPPADGHDELPDSLRALCARASERNEP